MVVKNRNLLIVLSCCIAIGAGIGCYRFFRAPLDSRDVGILDSPRQIESSPHRTEVEIKIPLLYYKPNSNKKLRLSIIAKGISGKILQESNSGVYSDSFLVDRNTQCFLLLEFDGKPTQAFEIAASEFQDNGKWSVWRKPDWETQDETPAFRIHFNHTLERKKTSIPGIELRYKSERWVSPSKAK